MLHKCIVILDGRKESVPLCRKIAHEDSLGTFLFVALGKKPVNIHVAGFLVSYELTPEIIPVAMGTRGHHIC